MDRLHDDQAREIQLVKRVRVFVKGNVDVYDSLHSCTVAGELRWNGVNEVVRRRHPGASIRLKHETWTRSDALLSASGAPPETLAARALNLGAYPLAAQFSTALFEVDADVVVLSIQPDVATGLFQHKAEGFLFYPSEQSQWALDDQKWLKEAFHPLGPLTVDRSLLNFKAIIDRLQSKSDAPILIYNLSPIIPGEQLHCYQGLGEVYATRARRFNLGLCELSEETGISIVDVDTLLARAGADRLKLDAIHLTPEGYALVADEVVSILDNLGVFETARALA